MKSFSGRVERWKVFATAWEVGGMLRKAWAIEELR